MIMMFFVSYKSQQVSTTADVVFAIRLMLFVVTLAAFARHIIVGVIIVVIITIFIITIDIDVVIVEDICIVDVGISVSVSIYISVGVNINIYFFLQTRVQARGPVGSDYRYCVSL